MRIQFFCPRWGSENIGWEEFVQKVHDEGYHGIEYAISRGTTEKELDTAWNTAARLGLLMIAQHYDTGEADFDKHFDSYAAWLERIKNYPVVKINSQTGRDLFSFGQNKKLIELAAGSGLSIVHETHRGKFSFAAHIAKDYLERIPELRITLDASHWVCVAESYLDDQKEAMNLAITRTNHIHARVGYPEGPQVPDPRTREWSEALEKHLRWWDRVAAQKSASGELLTITPEFGPFPYMVHLPRSAEPVADQWAVNVFMMELLQKRYTTLP